MHHRRVETVLLDPPGRANLHLTQHAEAIHRRVERAKPVRQLLRQHRDDPTRKIDRSAAAIGLRIKRRARSHIVGHIGNRHKQTETAAFRRAIDGIVKVARILAVDGDQRQRPDILTLQAFRGLAQIGLAHDLRQLPSLGSNGLRKFKRQVMFTQGDLNLHTGVGIASQNIGDATDHRRVLRRILNHLDHNHLAKDRRALVTLRDDDVLVNTRVLGNHPLVAMLDVVTTHHRTGNATLQHLDNLALAATAMVRTVPTRHDAITVQHLMHLLFGQA